MAPALGLLIDWIANEYADDIISSARRWCQARGKKLLVLPVGQLAAQVDKKVFLDAVSPFLEPGLVDRVLFCSAQLTGQGGARSNLLAFTRLIRVPLVSMGSAFGDLPLVSSDLSSAVDQLVEHLAVVHGCVRFAWLGGPENNQESTHRLECFERSIGRRKLRLVDDLVVSGDLGHEAGLRFGAVLADRRSDWDAVLAANDEMALGLIASLGPGAKICGIDNSSLASTYDLTTIDIRTGQLVHEALELLDRLCNKAGPAEDTVLVPGILVQGSSCTCSREGRPHRIPVPSREVQDQELYILHERLLKCPGPGQLEKTLRSTLSREVMPRWYIGNESALASAFLAEPLAPGNLYILHVLYQNSRFLGYFCHQMAQDGFRLSQWLRMDLSLVFHQWNESASVSVASAQERASRELMAKLIRSVKMALESLPVLLFELDEQLVIRYCNAEALGLRDHRFLDLLGKKDQEGLRQFLAEHQHESREPGQDRLPLTLRLPGNQDLTLAFHCTVLDSGGDGALAFQLDGRRCRRGYRLTALPPGNGPNANMDIPEAFLEQHPLSRREREVLARTMSMDIASIASDLGLGEATVRVHLHSLYQKTGVRNHKGLLELVRGYGRAH